MRSETAGARATGAPAVTRRNLRLRPRGVSLYLLPAALYLAVLVFYPFIELLHMSVSSVSSDNIFGDWPFIGTAGVQAVAGMADFREAAVSSLIYVVLVVGVGLGGGLAAALVLWRGGPLAGFTLALMVFSWALPGLINGVDWRFLLDPRGMIDTILGMARVPPVYWLVEGRLPLISVALVNAWTVVPFATLVFRAALLDMPSEMLAAAEVDGARPLQMLQYIVLPLLRPTILILTILSLLYAFKSFDFIYVMTFGGPGTASTTLPFLSYRLAFELYRFSDGAAVAVITLGLIVLMAVLYLRSVQREERA